MSVRKQRWTTERGEAREAWVCQYSTIEKDDRGKRRRHVKFFRTKKEASDFEAQVRIDIGKGIHTPASKSLTVEKAGELWLASCEVLERSTRDEYARHLKLHINPHL